MRSAVVAVNRFERAMRRTDPEDPRALELDARALAGVLVRAWGDDAARVARRVLELAQEAIDSPPAYRRAVTPRPPSVRASGRGGAGSGGVENPKTPDSGAGTVPLGADRAAGRGEALPLPGFGAQRGDP